MLREGTGLAWCAGLQLPMCVNRPIPYQAAQFNNNPLLEVADWSATPLLSNVADVVNGTLPAVPTTLKLDLHNSTVKMIDALATFQFRLKSLAIGGAAWTNNDDR